MKQTLLFGVVLATFFVVDLAAATYEVPSPDGRTVVGVEVTDRIAYSVTRAGRPVILPSPVSLTLEGGRVLGRNPQVKEARKRPVDEQFNAPVRFKRAVVIDKGNELVLDCGDYSVIFRAYDDGFAYRFATRLRGDLKILAEEATFNLPADFSGFLPLTKTMMLSFEMRYVHQPISKMAGDDLAYLPIVLEGPGTVRLAITESALEDYPGMFLKKGAGTSLVGTFAAYPTKEQPRRDRYLDVVERADYLAATKGTRSFPWRLGILADQDRQLIESDMVYRLADPCRIEDTSWIRPGKVAWDWWNANNLYGVDFESGVNTPTYKYYIDFAAKHGLEYIILDEGWSDTQDLLRMKPDVDMEELVRYAGEKKVGLVLWVVWLALDRQLEPAMEMFERWGIKGIKVDFMDRDDQPIVNYYWKIAEESAKRKLLVDFHGAYKPAGLERTYPNVITREGVIGLEYSKWSDWANPEHDLIIPFTRMLAGPMDYTPGAMVNAHQKEFRAIFERPMSQGTRVHQLAMYVVYESPLQMLCDSPSNYEREPEIMEFLSRVPSVWDETRVLDGKIGDYVIIARRTGEDWYIGAMTDWTPRTLTLDLSFLGGSYTADIWQDGVNAQRWASDYGKLRQVTSPRMEIKLASGGGWVARLTKAGR
jgi:alpha-glucosidase